MAMPTTESTACASRRSISSCVVMPPAAVTRRVVARRTARMASDVGAAHQAFGVDVGVEELTAERLQGADGIHGPDGEDRLPAVNRDVAAPAVHRGNDLLGADRVGQLLRELEVGLAVLEERRPGDDLPGARRQHVARAFDRADAAADAARQGARDLADDVEVVALAHGGVQVDHLHLREALEPPHPAKDVLVPDGEALALHELHDGAVLQIDRRNQHQASQRRHFVSS